MFNFNSVLTKKAEPNVPADNLNTSLLGCRTNVVKEDLTKANIYSSLGSHQTIQDSVANSKVVAQKSEPENIWKGCMEGLFN